MATLKLFIDTQNRRLVQAFDTTAAFIVPAFYLGDTGLSYEVHLLAPAASSSIGRPYEYISPTGATIDLALGLIDQAPTGGTFTLTDSSGSQTTAAIAYNASASTVQTAIRAALTTNYGSCTVTGNDGGPWTIDRVTTGTIVALGGTGTSLSPDSFVGIAELRPGTVSLSSRQRVRLLQQPACYDTASGTLPSAAVTVTTKQAGSATANEVQRVSINSDSYDGSFSLTSTTLGAGNATTATTGPIPYNATAEELQTIVNASFGTNNDVAVTQVNPWTWDVEFTGTNVDKYNMATMTGDASGLNVPVGVTGTLDLNTATALGLVGDETSVAVTFEIQQTRSGSVTTLYQAGTTIVNDLIDPQSTGATELPGYYTIAQADALFSTKENANGGFSAGNTASTNVGGAIGNAASSVSGGAMGNAASTSSGGAMGDLAQSTTGGAVGDTAVATTGGAVGAGAIATTGFAGGAGAEATAGGANLLAGTYAGTGLAVAGNEIANVGGQITAPKLTTDGGICFYIGATPYYAHVSGGNLTFNDTP